MNDERHEIEMQILKNDLELKKAQLKNCIENVHSSK